MNFICFDTEDNSKELGEAIAAGKKGVSMFDKKVTQIAAMTDSYSVRVRSMIRLAYHLGQFDE